MFFSDYSANLLEQGFSTSSTVDTFDNSLLWGTGLCVVGCLAAPCLCPLDTSSFPPVVTRNVSRHWQMFPRKQNCPWLRTTILELTVCQPWV